MDLSITFSRTYNSSSNDIYISATSNKSYLMSAGFPYGNGEPYDGILVNTDFYNTSVNRTDAISCFTHELGHCIGFRHNDYMNRVFSCSENVTVVNEGSTSTGAIHLPGTTSSPNPGSWMLACSDGTDRHFTLDDILALKIIYSYRKNIYVKEVLHYVTSDYWYDAYSDWEMVQWVVYAEFYQDANHTIPYTTAGNFVLNMNIGSESDYEPYAELIPDGLTSASLGTFTRERYYSYGTLVQDNSSGYRVASFPGYWGP
ncbi:M57 family metalloprotease [Pedobacter sp. BMA]|uniref:M57 family metalloprotease n=1 Tax=Pedobacter sp. BMA TaxID=1663685 RepID=UPI00069FDDA5|nr:M57 family metalloprotease [Pedobacter sp. BMA]